jgi:hypothetical protein
MVQWGKDKNPAPAPETVQPVYAQPYAPQGSYPGTQAAYFPQYAPMPQVSPASPSGYQPQPQYTPQGSYAPMQIPTGVRYGPPQHVGQQHVGQQPMYGEPHAGPVYGSGRDHPQQQWSQPMPPQMPPQGYANGGYNGRQ